MRSRRGIPGIPGRNPTPGCLLRSLTLSSMHEVTARPSKNERSETGTCVHTVLRWALTPLDVDLPTLYVSVRVWHVCVSAFRILLLYGARATARGPTPSTKSETRFRSRVVECGLTSVDCCLARECRRSFHVRTAARATRETRAVCHCTQHLSSCFTSGSLSKC